MNCAIRYGSKYHYVHAQYHHLNLNKLKQIMYNIITVYAENRSQLKKKRKKKALGTIEGIERHKNKKNTDMRS